MNEAPQKTICIIDGHGGGIGAAIIKYIRQFHENSFKLVALGTNAIATAGMLKAGAHNGASGENARIQKMELVNHRILFSETETDTTDMVNRSST
jgi:hypothetical protein